MTLNSNCVFKMEILYSLILGICTVFAAADTKFSTSILAKNDIVKPRIVGGETAVWQGDFPYQVSIRLNTSNDHFCGGSIISNRFILTAAHCAQEHIPRAKWIVAHMGSLNVKHGGVDMYMDKIISHTEWDRMNRINDIALLRTAQEIIFSDTIQPIALPKRDLPKRGNTPALLSGWGANTIVRIYAPLYLNAITILARVFFTVFRIPNECLICYNLLNKLFLVQKTVPNALNRITTHNLFIRRLFAHLKKT